MKLFHCAHCQEQVYFDNHTCLSCGAVLAFLPLELTLAGFVLASQDGPPGFFSRLGQPEDEPCRWRPCVNRHSARQCNWAVSNDDNNVACESCRLTDAAACAPESGHEKRWYAAECSKRRLVYTLLSLGIPLQAKQGPDDWAGLAFVWRVAEGGEAAVTGHDDGTITLDLMEADDDHRESARVAFNEPLRTVLGHLRHEISHYLDMRFVDTNAALAQEFTQLMGDKQRDYPQALQQHYQNGAPPDWQQHHISAYASAHPWEDWAETCAHYLLMVDAVETASAWGLRLEHVESVGDTTPDNVSNLPAQRLVVKHWLPVSRFLNAMARAIGLRDSYPFVIAPNVLDKLDFVQRVLQQAPQSPHAAPGNAPVQSVQPSPVLPYV